MPTMMTRRNTMIAGAWLPMLSRTPNSAQTMSTKRTRRQAKIRASPRDFTGIAAVAMA